MLSLCELRRAARAIQDGLMHSRLRRVIRTDEHSLVLSLDAQAGRFHLRFSVHPEYARIGRSDRPESAAPAASFDEYVRAHLVGSLLVGIDPPDADRQVSLRFQSRSEAWVWLFSILGARSNIYLLSGEGKIIHSLRPIDETRRDLKIGGDWSNPRGPAPSEGMDRWERLPDALYLESIEKTYLPLELTNLAEKKARRIEQAIKKERSFLQRKFVNLKEDLAEAQQAEAYRHKGELLKNVLHTIRPGESKALAKDYATGEIVEIALAPRLTPAENLESYFLRYQKESRGVPMIGKQLEEIESARAELEQIEQRAAAALEAVPPDVAALENILAHPAIHRLLRRQSATKKREPLPVKSAKHKEMPARLLPKRYRTEDGMEIWVGRSDEGNDYLTTRLARGNDLFFHLEGYPGGHVILRTEGRPDPPSSSLLAACELAVHFSKLKNAGHADVHAAPVKDVKKPKGAKPGLVYVRRGKTIHLRRDPSRLQNILASRLDD